MHHLFSIVLAVSMAKVCNVLQVLNCIVQATAYLLGWLQSRTKKKGRV
jgi:hypothetical protein